MAKKTPKRKRSVKASSPRSTGVAPVLKAQVTWMRGCDLTAATLIYGIVAFFKCDAQIEDGVNTVNVANVIEIVALNKAPNTTSAIAIFGDKAANAVERINAALRGKVHIDQVLITKGNK